MKTLLKGFVKIYFFRCIVTRRLKALSEICNLRSETETTSHFPRKSKGTFRRKVWKSFSASGLEMNLASQMRALGLG